MAALRLPVLFVLLAGGLASPAIAQSGDPPPPPLLEDEDPFALDPDPEPDDPSERPDPGDAPPSVIPAPDQPLEREVVLQSPIFAAMGGAVGGGGAAALSALAVYAAILALAPGPSNFGTLFILVGGLSVPFIAGFGAGAAILPMGDPHRPEHYAQLCQSCLAVWACAACALGGGGGINIGANVCSGADGPPEERGEMYWAAVGAGLGTVIGGAVGLYAVSQNTTDENVWMVGVAGGGVVGAALGGGAGAGIGAMVHGWEF